MHKNNRHIHGYNFEKLVNVQPKLASYIIENKFNQQSTIDFSNSKAVKLINLALLQADYKITTWDIPNGYLCPAIPGRADYIHHLKDLLDSTPEGYLTSSNIYALDIGTGASCVYPIIGQSEYNWKFVASDIDPISIKNANNIIFANNALKNKIECRLQTKKLAIFDGIINDNEHYHLTMCNPPFHNSLREAEKGSIKKWINLDKQHQYNKGKVNLNFGGQKAELFCPGGELKFIQRMIKESKWFKHQVLWFTCLISKVEHIKKLKLKLKKSEATQIKVVRMNQGNKVSRFIAWSFM